MISIINRQRPINIHVLESGGGRAEPYGMVALTIAEIHGQVWPLTGRSGTPRGAYRGSLGDRCGGSERRAPFFCLDFFGNQLQPFYLRRAQNFGLVPLYVTRGAQHPAILCGINAAPFVPRFDMVDLEARRRAAAGAFVIVSFEDLQAKSGPFAALEALIPKQSTAAPVACFARGEPPR